METHYKVLGIHQNATPEELKKAYFAMAKKYHPDSGDESEVKKFHEVAEAYRVLSDPVARKAYDVILGAAEDGAKKVETGPTFESVHVEKRASYRDEELREFHRNRYMKAVLRVVFFSLLLGVIGTMTGLVLGGGFLGSGTAGVLIGFGFSINHNFNLRSFFTSDRAHVFSRVVPWSMVLGGVAYFIFLAITTS